MAGGTTLLLQLLALAAATKPSQQATSGPQAQSTQYMYTLDDGRLPRSTGSTEARRQHDAVVTSTPPAAWEDTPLKVIILAGQSNMEGQAERDSTYGHMCKEQLPGQLPVCCWEKNVTGCCPDSHSHGQTHRCAHYNHSAGHNHQPGEDPCPHDAVQGPTNDRCYKNGTLRYQTLDPRTAAEFGQAWDNEASDWRVLDDVLIWFNEGSGCWTGPNQTCRSGENATQHPCPKSYCQTRNASASNFCNSSYLLGGCGRWGGMAPRYGAFRGHGPELGFAYALRNDPDFKATDEQILLLKVAYGGTSLAGDWRPPSSTLNNKTAGEGTVGSDYLAMVNYVHTVLAPESLAMYFPNLKKRPSTQIVGFGWWQGWQDVRSPNSSMRALYNNAF